MVVCCALENGQSKPAVEDLGKWEAGVNALDGVGGVARRAAANVDSGVAPFVPP